MARAWPSTLNPDCAVRALSKVPVSEPIMRYAVSLARTSRPGEDGAPDFVEKWVEYGASVRAAQYIILGAGGEIALSSMRVSLRTLEEPLHAEPGAILSLNVGTSALEGSDSGKMPADSVTSSNSPSRLANRASG